MAIPSHPFKSQKFYGYGWLKSLNQNTETIYKQSRTKTITRILFSQQHSIDSAPSGLRVRASWKQKIRASADSETTIRQSAKNIGYFRSAATPA